MRPTCSLQRLGAEVGEELCKGGGTVERLDLEVGFVQDALFEEGAGQGEVVGLLGDRIHIFVHASR